MSKNKSLNTQSFNTHIMKHQFFNRFIVSALALAAMGTASAYDFESDGIYYNVLSFADKTCEVTRGTDSGYNVYSGDIVVPATATINGRELNVVAIGASAFANSPNLKSVVLPESITEVGGEAFKYDDNLTSVVLPNSVKVIGVGLFERCSKLKQVTLPDKLTSIPRNTFYNCKLLSDITLPETVLEIGYSAFYHCESLKTINLDNVRTIGDLAFCICPELSEVNFSEYLTEIGYSAFKDCTSLQEIIIPDNVTDLPGNVFVGCTSLKKVTIGYSVKKIDSTSFGRCEAITDIYAYPRIAPKGGEFPASVYMYSTLHVTPAAKESYEESDGWKDFWNIKDDLEKKIPDNPDNPDNPDYPHDGIHVVYFRNTSDCKWYPVFFYGWNSTGGFSMTWPGEQMLYTSLNGSPIWKYSFEGSTPTGILFNDGISGTAGQTKDLAFYDGGIYDINGFVELAGVDDCVFVNSGVRAWSEGGVLYVSVTGSDTAKVAVVSIDGRVRELPVSEGLNTFDTLPRGIYIVNGAKIAL